MIRRPVSRPVSETVGSALWAAFRAAFWATGLAGPALAQSLGTCDDYRSSIFALAEPWEDSTRVFADGAVRLAVADTIEPAAAAFHLVLLAPPYDEVGARTCTVISGDEGTGFAGLTLVGIEAEGDAATGLRFGIPATRWLPDTDSYADAVLTVTLNPATGAITAKLD